MRKVVIAAEVNKRLNAKQIQNVLDLAEEGSRINIDGKVVYPGFGNRSGLHSYLNEAIRNVWTKGKNRLTKALNGDLTLVTVLQFVNKNRDTGNWINCGTIAPHNDAAKPTSLYPIFRASARRTAEPISKLGSPWKPTLKAASKFIPLADMQFMYVDSISHFDDIFEAKPFTTRKFDDNRTDFFYVSKDKKMVICLPPRTQCTPTLFFSKDFMDTIFQ